MRMKTFMLAGTIVAGLATVAIAQQSPQGGHQMHQQMMKGGQMDPSKMEQMKGGQMDHSKHGGGTATSPSTAAFQAANAKMHQGMDIKFSDDADIDFIKGMIPHHQGAIDMAKVVLGFGKDPETRKLAEEIIVAQEKEIAMMKDWLKKKGQ